MKTLASLAFVLVSGVLIPSACQSQGRAAASTPAYMVVEEATSNVSSGLALVDEHFERLASTRLGTRLEFAASPSRAKIAAAWMDSEAHRFLQVFHTNDLTPACAKTSISSYATTTTGFWRPILWIGESELVVEFVTEPRSSPDPGFDRFHLQVFQLPRQENQPLTLRPHRPELIALPPDNTHILGISHGNAIELNGALELRTVNLETGVMGQAIEVRPKGQDGLMEAPMGWCFKDDSTLPLFGFAGGVKEIRLGSELKVVHTSTLPDLPSGAHVAQAAIERDPFRPDPFLIGTHHIDRTGPVEIDKAGPVEVRALNGLMLIESRELGDAVGFAAAKDGAILSWSYGPQATIRIQGSSGSSEFTFDGAAAAIVPLR